MRCEEEQCEGESLHELLRLTLDLSGRHVLYVVTVHPTVHLGVCIGGKRAIGKMFKKKLKMK